MSNERDLRKHLRRDESINKATPGHRWFPSESPQSVAALEINPSKLNLDNVQDFLKFLNALADGEEKSLAFLSKISQERIQFLKQKHSHLSSFFPVLNQ